MNHSINPLVSLIALLGAVACSGGSTSETTTNSGGTSHNGGNGNTNVGGNSASSGGSTATGAPSGGTSSNNATASNSVASGGSDTSSGVVSSTGGNTNTGASVGGNSSSSSSSGKGGGSSTNAATTGGTSIVASGGSGNSSGGASSVGGKSGAGGSSGASGMGGAAPSGGSTATGGSTASSSGIPMPPLPLLVTSTASALWQTGTISTTTSGTATITVDDSQTFQTFNGFGGCFNEKGWYYLKDLSATDQAKAMALLFDVNDGANFQYGRIPIGANDFAVTAHSEDDTANDTSLSNFSIAEDEKYIIPYIQAAQAVNPNIHFWGSPWSPPGWMKTGGTGTANLNGGKMKNDSATFTAYANYFVKWVQAYAAKNITIDAVAPQNEPNYPTGYPSCSWKAADFASFVGGYLGPALKAANLSTTVMLGNMSRNDNNADTGESDQSVATAVLGDATAMGFVKSIGLQWNMMQSGAFIPSGVASSSLPKWQTEHKCGNYSWGGAAYGQTYNSSAAPNDFGYAEESWGNIHDWLKAGVSVYSAWNMVLDPKGLSTSNWPQDTLIVADPTAKTLTPKPAYYAFRHFSQYTKPGAKRVGTTGDVSCSGDGIGKCAAGIAAIAFKNPDGTHVVSLFNTNSSSAQVVLAIGSTKLQFTMPGTSFATAVN